MTISKAYNLLERDGVLERRPGRPLVVAAMDAAEIELEKIEQLRTSLAEAVRVARQLGIDAGEALRIYHELLQGACDEEQP